MTLPYGLRLVSVCLALFFIVHTVAGFAVALLIPAAIQRSERLRASAGARLLLRLRFLPAALALLGVALCIPSYLWFEPEAAGEEVRGAFLAAAVCGLAVCVASIARGIAAAVRSVRFQSRQRRAGCELRLAGAGAPLWLVESRTPLCALAGILRPQILFSRGLLRALPADELAVVLRHERAHLDARDNLIRLLFVITPEAVPFWRCFHALEDHWARLSEFAADDRAAAGDAPRSLSLAAALVRVARMGSALRLDLASSLVAEERDLEERVERLLQVVSAPEECSKGRAARWAGAAIAAALLVVVLHPAALQGVQVLMERLIH